MQVNINESVKLLFEEQCDGMADVVICNLVEASCFYLVGPIDPLPASSPSFYPQEKSMRKVCLKMREVRMKTTEVKRKKTQMRTMDQTVEENLQLRQMS